MVVGPCYPAFVALLASLKTPDLPALDPRLSVARLHCFCLGFATLDRTHALAPLPLDHLLEG